MYLVLIILLVILLLGGLPPLGLHSYGWGPSGMLMVVLVVIVVIVLVGHLR